MHLPPPHRYLLKRMLQLVMAALLLFVFFEGVLLRLTL